MEDYIAKFTNPKEWTDNVDEVLYTAEQIDEMVTTLASQISEDYKDLAGDGIIFVGLLKGCVIFFSDLVRKISVPHTIDFLSVSSYAGTESTGNIIMRKDIDESVLKDKHVIIVEDLIDTGHTLAWVVEHLKTKQPKSLKIVCLLNKEERRKTEVTIDYVGTKIPDVFICGYGMDFDEEYRSLPYLFRMKPSAYKK